MRRPAGDTGLSMIEFVITIALLSILGMVMVFGVRNNYQLQRSTQDETQGLADVRTLVERLGRDVRSSRGVYEGATESQLKLWVDTNSDYIPTSDELVTWQLAQQTQGSTQYNVIRQTEGGIPKIQSRTVISNIAFCYWEVAPPPNTSGCSGSLPVPLSADNAAKVRLVTTTTTYDAVVGSGTQPRTVSFSSRLRNVE